MADSVYTRLLSRRDTASGSQTTVIVLVIVISLLVISILVCFVYFNRRAKRIQRQRGFSKRQSWRESLASFSSAFHRPPPVRSDILDPSHTSSHEMEEGIEDADGVNRHESVRSIMTLPAYSAVPGDHEGVLGREGERAGMDTVVEFPETNEEEEDRREEEMESLYQIRQRRRQEAADRAERRRRRREARDRGDHATVFAIRQESQRVAQQLELSGSAALINEHETLPRGRRVSAVSYGEIGVARHDGSRVRANSNDSDRPLLDATGALGMAEPIRPWISREDVGSHRRGRSSVSNLSALTYDSDDQSGASDLDSDFDGSLPYQRGSRPNSRPHSQQRSATRSRAVSSARSLATSLVPTLALTTDLGDSRIPHPDPPQYDTVEIEEAPPYTSPVETRRPDLPPPRGRPSSSADTAPRLPQIERLPSIRITEGTPVDARPHDLPNFSAYGFS